jgi:hypothetical protein
VYFVSALVFALVLILHSSLSLSDSAAVARRHGGGDNDDEEKNGDNDENGYVEADGRFELPRLTGW